MYKCGIVTRCEDINDVVRIAECDQRSKTTRESAIHSGDIQRVEDQLSTRVPDVLDNETIDRGLSMAVVQACTTI